MMLNMEMFSFYSNSLSLNNEGKKKALLRGHGTPKQLRNSISVEQECHLVFIGGVTNRIERKRS